VRSGDSSNEEKPVHLAPSLVLIPRRFDEDPPSPNLDFSMDLALDARMLMKEEENHAALYLPFLAGSRSGGGRR